MSSIPYPSTYDRSCAIPPAKGYRLLAVPSVNSGPSAWEANLDLGVGGKNRVQRIHSSHTSTRQTLFAFDSLRFRSRYLPGAQSINPSGVSPLSVLNPSMPPSGGPHKRLHKSLTWLPSFRLHLLGKPVAKKTWSCCLYVSTSLKMYCASPVVAQSIGEATCRGDSGHSQSKQRHTTGVAVHPQMLQPVCGVSSSSSCKLFCLCFTVPLNS